LAVGFVACGPNSYIRDVWNILDFSIVLSSVFSMAASSDQLKTLKSLRALRVLRPLRLINKLRGFRIAL
jgi:voltage-dependent calcium channel L type alpha-1D